VASRTKGGDAVSYLSNYVTRRLAEFEASSSGVRLDLSRMLNLTGHHGSAEVRAWVEDTTYRHWKRKPPEPKIRLSISDCSNVIWLAFEANSPEQRTNSLHKADTLIDVLTRFRHALAAECELYELRCLHGRSARLRADA
jgi:hypothetical protein